jgi:hypothetical protein
MKNSIRSESSSVRLTLPDKSQVTLDKQTLQFHSLDTGTNASTPANLLNGPAVPLASKKIVSQQIDFKTLAKWLQYPHLRFGDCFRRISDRPRYSPKQSVHEFDVRFLTRLYEFPGNYQGGTFCSSTTEWHFLDGGIISRNGYGWGSHSWTVVEGGEALRGICMFFGIQQPLTIRGESPRRPLSTLLEEMTTPGCLKSKERSEDQSQATSTRQRKLMADKELYPPPGPQSEPGFEQSQQDQENYQEDPEEIRGWQQHRERQRRPWAHPKS